MSHRSFQSYSNYTNSSLFKVGLAAAGFFAGALIGAWAPELVFSTPNSTTSRSTPAGAPGGPTTEDVEDEVPLCVGPECGSMPPPKLPATAIALASPSPYHVARLTAFRDGAAASKDTSELERYALITHLIALHTESNNTTHSTTNTATITERLATLTQSTLFTTRFTLTHSTDTSLSRLRTLTSQSTVPLCRVTVAGEARWVAVVAVDAFYVYLVDNYTAGAVCYVSTREFSKAWKALDEDGNQQASEAYIVTPKMGSGQQTVVGEKKGAVQGRSLKAWQASDADSAQTHVVEIASL